MGIQDDIVAARQRREQNRRQAPLPRRSPALPPIDPIILLLEDFRTWAITNRVRSDEPFGTSRGWLLEQWYEPPMGDSQLGCTSRFVVRRRGEISYYKSRESNFDYIYSLVVNYVARYDYPWPNNNSARDYQKQAVRRS